MAFNQWLRQRRKLLDLTQGELAEQVGCSAVSIRKFESNDRKPSRQLAEGLARALRVPEREHQAFVQFARSQPAPNDFSLPAWSAEEISWRGAQLPTETIELSERKSSTVLDFDLFSVERPQMDVLEDGHTLVHLQASGSVTGTMEGQLQVDITQILVPKPPTMDYSQVLPMQIGTNFKLISGEDYIKGNHIGTMYPMMDRNGNGNSRVTASGHVISVSKGLLSFFLNYVFVEYEVKMVEGIGTGASGQMQLHPKK
ncbi:MAG: helix-turn-helix transcriptional regulator [Chloroflexi bacterium]|nr:helix-turn-helix transcriptional regulator [Chloroflexota bacterium]